MKKTMVAFMVVALFGWGLSAVSPAEAADPSAGITVTVTVEHISVSVTPTTVAFTTVLTGSNTVSSKLDVTNSGNVDEDYSLQLTKDVYAVGTTEAAAAEDVFVLEALFLADGATAPTDPNFGADGGAGDDVVLETVKAASATDFGLSADSDNGLSVAAGALRDLYLNYGAPTSVTTGDQENLVVTLTTTAG